MQLAQLRFWQLAWWSTASARKSLGYFLTDMKQEKRKCMKCMFCEYEDEKGTGKQLSAVDWLCNRCAWFWNKAYKNHKSN